MINAGINDKCGNAADSRQNAEMQLTADKMALLSRAFKHSRLAFYISYVLSC